MIERTTVRLPTELLDRARRQAAAEGRTLTALIEDGLRLVVSRKKPVPTKRRLPPVSKATGGLRPGIDPHSHAAFQEIEDLEYVERMKGFR